MRLPKEGEVWNFRSKSEWKITSVTEVVVAMQCIAGRDKGFVSRNYPLAQFTKDGTPWDLIETSPREQPAPEPIEEVIVI